MNGDITEIFYEKESNGFDNKIYLHFFAFENSFNLFGAEARIFWDN